MKKRMQKRLIVGKSERGERELSVDYRIVDNERQEEKMCDPRTHGAIALRINYETIERIVLNLVPRYVL